MNSSIEKVPISRLKGNAEKIFEDVNNSGTIVVEKYKKPVGVIMPYDDYLKLLNILDSKNDN